MKFVVFTTLAVLAVAAIAADDTHIQIGAGGIAYFSDSEDKYISLENEVINFDFDDKQYSMNVDFEFVNSSDSVLTYDIGFPVHSHDFWKKNYFIENAIPLDGFSTSVNGVEVAFKMVDKSEDDEFSKWYTKSVAFQPQTTTRINIRYSTRYGASGGGVRWASYFYGSAYIWKGPIKTLVVNLKNSSDMKIFRLDKQKAQSEKSTIEITDPTSTRITYEKIKPTKDSQIDVYLSQMHDQGMWESDTTKDFKIFPDMFLFYTASQLRIYRNLFYATNGLIFKSKDLTEFFSEEPWYKPKYENVDALLNQNERAAIRVIQDLEARRQRS